MECQEIALGDREALTVNYWFLFFLKRCYLKGFLIFFGGFFYIYFFFDKVANSTKKITEWIS